MISELAVIPHLQIELGHYLRGEYFRKPLCVSPASFTPDIISHLSPLQYL